LSTIRSLAGSIVRNPSLRSAFFAFALTRAIVLVAVILAANAHHDGAGPAFGGPVQEVTVSLREPGLIQRFAKTVEVADGIWYMNIARNGYEKKAFNLDEQHNWAFFPLYPLVVNAAARVTGEFPLTAALLSNIFLFAALIILYRTALLFGLNDSDADRAVFYIAAFPMSYFFSFPFTESLFLLLTVSSFFCAKREMWWRAGILGALASATRLAGIFLLPALLVLYWQRYRTRGLRPRLLGLCLIPTGLFAYMLYLRGITGNAFAFFDIQATWGHRVNFFLGPLYDYAISPLLLAVRWDFRALNFAAVMLAFLCCAALLKQRRWALATYALLSLIVPLSAAFNLQSMARYVLVIFPIFFVMGGAARSHRRDQVISALFIVLLGLLTATFTLGIALALS